MTLAACSTNRQEVEEDAAVSAPNADADTPRDVGKPPADAREGTRDGAPDAGAAADASTPDGGAARDASPPDEGPRGPWTVRAPDGAPSLAVRLGANGAPEWQLGAGDAVVIPWSPLGVRRSDTAFVDGLTFLSASDREIDDRYTMLRGKRRDVAVRARERTLSFRNGSGRLLDLTIRAQRDGVAFRYAFPDRSTTKVKLLSESTGFRIDTKARAILHPHDGPGEYTPAYERYWESDVASGAAPAMAVGWSFPALFEIPGASGKRHAVLITESGPDRSGAATHLARATADGLYAIALPEAAEGQNTGTAEPESTLPWALPWRIVLVGDTHAPIVESTMVTDLAPPSVVADTSWIRPGRVAWSWWSDPTSPRDYNKMVPFVDFASEMGWEYFLVDANWPSMTNGDWKRLASYAAGKSVKIMLWYNSGGPNNKVTEQPRDRMTDPAIRRAEMKAIAEAGVAGIKVDFFQSDKQLTMAQYHDVLEDAATHRLLVNFHGCTLPRGWERTYPHLMTLEAVRGAEHYQFENVHGPRAPQHNAILPFTRNVVGPMDYTPVTFTTKFLRTTTNAHELALGVVFESGLQHLADSPASYRARPRAVIDLLKRMPVAWDDTRFIVGEPAKHIVLARKKGTTWYVAGINGESTAKTIEVPLAFLGAGSFTLRGFVDGGDASGFAERMGTRTATARESVMLGARGGFVLELSPAP